MYGNCVEELCCLAIVEQAKALKTGKQEAFSNRISCNHLPSVPTNAQCGMNWVAHEEVT